MTTGDNASKANKANRGGRGGSGKPICFLDIDGVFHLFAAAGGSEHLYEQCVVYRNDNGYLVRKPVLLDRRHPALVADLAEDFELVWGTAWEHYGNLLMSPLLGLGELPVVEFPSRRPYGRRGGRHWKTETLVEYAAGRPFCWLDDEATEHDQRWLGTACESALVIPCDPGRGLGEHEADLAQRFASGTAQPPYAHLQRPTA
jgi:hypothetical protein